MKLVKAGKGDSELLAYVMANLKPKRTPSEIKAWSAWYEQQAPGNPDSRAFFNDVHRKNAAHRKDIETWFDWLELDDYVTFGGKP
jgi:7,8-dihydro-6-hydroxymethylpterin-pyrophosphokinase